MPISVQDAYRVDPVTGQVDMNLFRQFAAQQQANNAAVNPNSPFFTGPSLTEGQRYMAANPDVMASAQAQAIAAGIEPGQGFADYMDDAARDHFDTRGQVEIDQGMRQGGDYFSPLSTFGSTDPIQTVPYSWPTASIPLAPSNIPDAPVYDPINYGPAPMPGQLPGYSFTANPDFYANELGTMGGLLGDVSGFYAGQVPLAPAYEQQTGGYNHPELALYPNANYMAGAFPIIWTS